MSLKKIIIYQNKILFNILNELYADKFSFLLVDEKNFNDLSSIKESSDLIIVNQNNSNFKNQIVLKDFPLDIKKILELININLLKNSYKLQSQIKIGSYNLNLNSKEISLDNKKLFLTERESNLILFLKNSVKPVNINQLQKELYSNVMQFPSMERIEQMEHIELLTDLLDKQKVMYARLSLSDDPEAIKMKKHLQQSIPLMGFPTGTDMNLLFDGMKKTISKLKENIDKS